MNALRAAIRPTVRDFRQSFARSLAAILLVMLPVALMSFYGHETKSQLAAEQLLRHDTTISYHGQPCEQSFTGESACTNDADTPAVISLPAPTALHSVFGDRIRLYQEDQFDLIVNDGVQDHAISVLQQDPELFQILGIPLAADEIILTTGAAETLGVKIGDTVEASAIRSGEAVEPSGEVVEHSAAAPMTLTVKDISPLHSSFVSPAADFSQQLAAIRMSHTTSWIATGLNEITWSDVKAANTKGFVIDSRYLQDHPDSIAADEMYPQFREELLYAQQHDSEITSLDAYWLGALSFGYIILGILLLLIISPVFAINASRQSRVYALMRTQGATRNQIRVTIMAYGTCAGLVSAIAGVLTGTLIFIGSWKYDYPHWPLHFDLTMSIFAAVLAIIGSTMAAFLPSLMISRGPILSHIQTGAPGRLRSWKPWMAIGPVCFTLSLAFLVIIDRAFTGLSTDNPTNILIIPWLIQLLFYTALISALASLPALIMLFTAIARPLSWKIAARMVRRQAVKSVATTAALLGITLVITSFSMVERSSNHHHLHTPIVHANVLTVQTYGPWGGADITAEPPTTSSELPPLIAAGVKALEAQVSTVRVLPLETLAQKYVFVDTGCEILDAETLSSDQQHEQDRLCRYERYREFSHYPFEGETIVTDGQVLEYFELTPDERAQAQAVLDAGGFLGNRMIVPQATRTITVNDYGTEENPDTAEYAADLPFAAVLPESFEGVVISPRALAKLSPTLTPQISAAMVVAAHDITTSDIHQLREAAQHEEFYYQFAQPIPAQFPSFELYFGIFLLIIIGLIIVLNSDEMLKLHAQLRAIGASQRFLTLTTAAHASLTAIIGLWPPLIIGHVLPMLFMNTAVYDSNHELIAYSDFAAYQPNWALLGFVGIGVPALAFGLGIVSMRALQTKELTSD